jgi:SAM-dependent methyltransferase
LPSGRVGASVDGGTQIGDARQSRDPAIAGANSPTLGVARYNADTVDPAVLPILSCPRCRSAAPFRELRHPRCKTCGLEPASAPAGVLDLLDVATRGEPAAANTEQRLMESALVARIYDRIWRPTFVRLLAGRGAGASVGGISGELFIHKHSLALDDRPGPWLDLSCGPGAFTRALAAAAPAALVVAVDISRAMLEVAAQRTGGYSNVVLVRADAHSLPFVDGAFGGVNNAGALHAYDDPEQVFRELHRVLRPGGIYVGSTFAEAPSLLGRLTARAAGIRRFEAAELRAWLQRIGFADYEDVHLGGALVFRVRRP